MRNNDFKTLSIQIDSVENGYALLVFWGSFKSGHQASRYVFNDLEEMNRFLTNTTEELE
jgi:hypothetical protein